MPSKLEIQSYYQLFLLFSRLFSGIYIDVIQGQKDEIFNWWKVEHVLIHLIKTTTKTSIQRWSALNNNLWSWESVDEKYFSVLFVRFQVLRWIDIAMLSTNAILKPGLKLKVGHSYFFSESQLDWSWFLSELFADSYYH